MREIKHFKFPEDRAIYREAVALCEKRKQVCLPFWHMFDIVLGRNAYSTAEVVTDGKVIGAILIYDWNV